MVKRISILACIFLGLMAFATAEVIEEKSYKLISFAGSLNTNFDIAQFIIFPPSIYGGDEVKLLTRSECKKLAEKTIEDEAKIYGDEKVIIRESYVIDYWHYHSSFCIPANKQLEECGLTGWSKEHLNIPDTPFICDKYNEQNPIPHIKWDNIYITSSSFRSFCFRHHQT